MRMLFKRIEKKYNLTVNQYESILKRLSSHVEENKYSNYTVHNIYYDNSKFEIINKSLEKPLYKEKLRLRSYDDNNYFLELKKKYKKEVFKRRICISKEAFEREDFSKVKNRQILEEIIYFKNLYNLEKKMLLNYHRKAFKGIEDDSVRITFDSNIEYGTEDLDFDCHENLHMINENRFIMEIKVNGAMPLWLVDILNELHIYPSSFSKYGNCYKDYVLLQGKVVN